MLSPPRHILHVTQQLSLGGAGRAALCLVRESCDLGGHRHTIVSLVPPHPAAVAAAARAGVPIVSVPDRATLAGLVGAADVVHVHFWNTPELYDVLRTPGPSRRTVMWSHVNGLVAPHVVTPELVRHSTAFVATSARSLAIPAVQAALDAGTGHVVPAAADPKRLRPRLIRSGAGLTVGTVCSLDFTKLHRDFVAICAAVTAPVERFVVCGSGPARGTLLREAAAAGLATRIECRGHVEDVGTVLAGIDVLLHPLCPDNTTTCDLALQEALLAGVPAVVMPHGGAADLVQHDETGLVADTPAACATAIDRLCGDLLLRQRLGTTAAARAAVRHSPAAMALRFHALYDEACRTPKHLPADPLPPARSEWRIDGESGAARFVRSLGDRAEPFAVALCNASGPAAADDDAIDAAIEAVGPLLAGPGGGGVQHYRGFYPSDPLLRFWSGLVFLGQGRPALAAAEFRGPPTLLGLPTLGAEGPRVQRHLVRALAAARASLAAGRRAG
jgi:glycosyltransferase involved in cell wall biosynthesis